MTRIRVGCDVFGKEDVEAVQRGYHVTEGGFLIGSIVCGEESICPFFNGNAGERVIFLMKLHVWHSWRYRIGWVGDRRTSVENVVDVGSCRRRRNRRSRNCPSTVVWDPKHCNSVLVFLPDRPITKTHPCDVSIHWLPNKCNCLIQNL